MMSHLNTNAKRFKGLKCVKRLCLLFRDGTACLSYSLDSSNKPQWVTHRRVTDAEDEYAVRHSQVNTSHL
jgi:hypothetical protein